jgi:hypothetical protein
MLFIPGDVSSFFLVLSGFFSFRFHVSSVINLHASPFFSISLLLLSPSVSFLSPMFFFSSPTFAVRPFFQLN